MGWLIAVAVIALLAIMPVGVRIAYNKAGFAVSLIVGLFRFKLFPRPPKEKKDAEEKPMKKKTEKPTEKQENASGGSFTDFLPIVKVALDFLNAFRQKIRIDQLNLKLTMGGDDPADLAVNYSRGWTALGALLPLLEQVFVIKKRDLEVQCDFTAEQTTVVAGADIKITVSRLLALAVCYGIRALKEYLNIMNKRKGGAKT